MSYVDDLLAELCPNGVRHLPLSSHEVANFSTGKQLNRETLSARGKYEVFNGGIGSSGWHSEYNTDGPAIIVSQGGASAGFVNFISDRFWAGAHCYVVTPGPAIDRRYLYHVLKSKQTSIQSTARGAGIPGLARGALGATVIPVPPLEVQNEIARVLDQFTRLEAELEAELEARRRQYEYYRDAVFEASSIRSEWKHLSEVGLFERGSSLQKKDLLDVGVPCIHYGQVYTFYGVSAKETRSFVSGDFARGKRHLNPGDVFVATTSENEEDLGKAVAWLGSEPAVASSDAYIFRPEMDARFVSHFFASTHFHAQKKRFITGTKVKRLSASAMEKMEIPVPEKAEQERIADSLDCFDGLVNDPSIGLPAELAARRKQYESYRDRLLTFKEATA